MRLIRCLSDFKGTKNGVALAIGNFDGLHKGHQAVIERMKLEAKNNQLTENSLANYNFMAYKIILRLLLQADYRYYIFRP